MWTCLCINVHLGVDACAVFLPVEFAYVNKAFHYENAFHIVHIWQTQSECICVWILVSGLWEAGGLG